MEYLPFVDVMRIEWVSTTFRSSNNLPDRRSTMLQEILESSVFIFRESSYRVLSQSFYRFSRNHSMQLRSLIVLLPEISVDYI